VFVKRKTKKNFASYFGFEYFYMLRDAEEETG
jgi:hypothetical protein